MDSIPPMTNQIEYSNSYPGHLHCQVTGDVDKPALLLVHGFLSSNLQWELNKEELSKHFQLFMVELWGHGQSPVPHTDSDYSIKRYVYELETIREQYNIKQWALVGHSYGAGIIMHYARYKPERCLGLVVTNSMSAFSPPGTIELGIKNENTIRRLGVKILSVHPSCSKTLPETLKKEMIIQADKVNIESAIEALHMRNQLSILPYTDSLPSTLVTNGIHEKEFQPTLKAAQEQWQNLKVKNLDGGHSININCAVEFNQAVIDFFSVLRENLHK